MAKTKEDLKPGLKKKLKKFNDHFNNVMGGMKRRGADEEEVYRARVYVSSHLLEAKPCHYCNEPLDTCKWSLDHAIPLSRGGSHKVRNLRVCCGRCNRRKGSLTNVEFIMLQAWIKEHFPTEAVADILRRLGMGGYGFRR